MTSPCIAATGRLNERARPRGGGTYNPATHVFQAPLLHVVLRAARGRDRAGCARLSLSGRADHACEAADSHADDRGVLRAGNTGSVQGDLSPPRRDRRERRAAERGSVTASLRMPPPVG